jgi:hypothetical protein
MYDDARGGRTVPLLRRALPSRTGGDRLALVVDATSHGSRPTVPVMSLPYRGLPFR